MFTSTCQSLQTSKVNQSIQENQRKLWGTSLSKISMVSAARHWTSKLLWSCLICFLWKHKKIRSGQKVWSVWVGQIGSDKIISIISSDRDNWLMWISSQKAAARGDTYIYKSVQLLLIYEEPLFDKLADCRAGFRSFRIYLELKLINIGE